MKRFSPFISFFMLFCFINIFSQVETCTAKEKIEDLNNIDKCNFNKVGNLLKAADTVNIIITPKRHYFKRRNRERLLNNSPKKSVEVNNPHKINKDFVKVIDFEDEIYINVFSFSQVDYIPQFKTCKDVDYRDQLQCFNIEMSKHIQENFYYPQKAIRKGIQGKVTVSFIIDEIGEVVNITLQGNKKSELLVEATRVMISNLPKFIPAKKGNKNVRVKYSFPVNYKLDQN